MFFYLSLNEGAFEGTLYLKILGLIVKSILTTDENLEVYIHTGERADRTIGEKII